VEDIGGANYCHILLQPLQHLASAEESAVREKTLQSLSIVIAQLNEAQINEHVLPLIKALAAGEWFTSRMSACGLFHVTIPRVNVNVKKELRALFLKLCQDETPMVRRAAAANLGKIVPVSDYETVKKDLLPALLKLAKDEQDSVRLLTIETSIAFARAFKAADNVTKMLPLLFSLCGDKSWRVRYMIADKFCDLCSSFGESEAKSDEIVDSFVRLLQDDEAEVRTAAAARCGDVAKLVGANQTVKKLLNPIKILVKDASQYTRAAIGSVLMGVGAVLKKKELIDNVLPLLLLLLKDTSAEVRLNIIAKLSTVQDVLQVDLLRDSLLPAIVELSADPKWRIRLSIIEHIPTLARQLGSEYFDAKLLDACMAWLGDSVYSIREAATANLVKLSEVFGKEWSTKNILPKIAGLATNKSYLYRMTALQCIKDLAKLIGPQATQGQLLPLVCKLCTDPVPNVRFTAARVLGIVWAVWGLEWGKGASSAAYGAASSALQTLSGDADPDCQFYATQSLNVVNSDKPAQALPASYTAPNTLSANNTGPAMLSLLSAQVSMVSASAGAAASTMS
jgi:serine/threonine-protein phosphatase 2A regulatory subunit A